MDNHDLPELHGSVCPIPFTHHEKIVLGHGSGGRMMQDLVERIFLPPLDNPILRIGDDAGVCSPTEMTRLAISTDSHVVWPLFFPGGDIGRLAICGTVNDLSMMGATPKYLTAGFILEEGLDIEIINKIVYSMQIAANEAKVQIVAGDTKVVQKGKADSLYINTSGVGLIPGSVNISGKFAKPGDIVILSGTIGDHGIAVLTARGELGFQSTIESDTAPLNLLVSEMIAVSKNIHVLRDPTRGGLATSLNEICHQSGVGILIREEDIFVHPQVQAACEMLGFDPLYVANEGKLVAIVAKEDAKIVLAAMRQNRYGKDANIIGEVLPEPKSRVLIKTTIGTTRIVDVLSGEMLPRIC
jgi:hydrogenase expression/formation protein HypE